MGQLKLYENYTYISPYEFEKYDYLKWERWITDYWHFSILASAIYVILVFVGQKWMESRPAFKLRKPLILWNIFLCVTSLMMFVRVYPGVRYEINKYGAYFNLCDKSELEITTSFWGLMFTLSKPLQFGDTAFIVLRKQPLSFLNWYHHAVVNIYVFYANAGDFDPSCRMFAALNSAIHTLMYGYFALRAMKIYVPKNIAMGITFIQIIEMFVGIYFNAISINGKLRGPGCDRPFGNMLWAFAIYVSMFYLFIQLFKQSYNGKSKKLE